MTPSRFRLVPCPDSRHNDADFTVVVTLPTLSDMAHEPSQSTVWKSLLTAGGLGQAVLVVGVSCGLGLAYNAASPVGIRWSEASRTAEVPSVAKVPVVAPTSAAPAIATPAIPAPPVPVVGTSAPAASPLAGIPSQYVPPTGATWAEIKPHYLKGEVVLVDARPRSTFEAGHIPGAISLPEPPSADELAAFTSRYATNSHLVVYCSSTSCSLSFKLAHRLAKDSGYGFVQYMTGGYLEWQRDEALGNGTAVAGAINRPAVREMQAQTVPPVTPPIAAAPNDVKLDNALPILWAQAKPLVGAGQALLLDARPKPAFDAGHIPGALWLPADADAEIIRQVIGDRPRATRVVTYCGAMGCPEAFQLASRLVREFDRPNTQFMLEGFAEWRKAEQSSAALPTPR